MEKLVCDLRASKKGAATRFYHAYAGFVRRYLLVKLPTVNEVEEIMQDTFMAALDSLPLYRGQSSVKTWLLSIARHEVADFYRKRYVRQAVEKTAPLFDEILSELSTPEFEMKKKKLKKRFMRAFHSLSPPHQDMISYRYELGMSVAEVAQRMKMSAKATESMLYRARQAFMVAYVQQR